MADFDTPELLLAIDEIDERNFASAYRLLVPLAEAGSPRAQCYLANLYHFGLGVNPDAEKAIALYLRFAEQNISEGHLSARGLSKPVYALRLRHARA